MTAVRAARLEDLPPGRVMGVAVAGARVALARVGDAVYACGDVCAHKGGSLSEGRLTGVRLACPLHGWLYDVRTGECVFPGRGGRVPTYPVRIDGDDVWVETP